MSLMYEVNALNAAMIQAAEVCRQDMPEGEKVNAVLACFAGMKPVEAELVVHAELESTGMDEAWCEWGNCTSCGNSNYINAKYCNWCGAKLRGGTGDGC